MDFSIRVKSIRSGWIEIEFVSGGTIYSAKVSNKSDPLDEFMDIVIKIDEFFRDPPVQDEKPFHLYLFWEGEKSQHTLDFIPDHRNGTVRVEISCCENIEAGIHMRDEKKISFELPFAELAAKTYSEMLSVLREYGFQGYRKEWQRSCFPVSYLLCLHKIVEGRGEDASGFLAEIASLNQICRTQERAN